MRLLAAGPHADLVRAHVVQGDLDRPPVKRGVFDFVYSFGVLHHVPEAPRTFHTLTELVKPGGPVELLGGRQLPGKELFVVRLAGIDSREAAEALVGEQLMVRSSDRPKLAKGEFHLLDLVGLEVRLDGKAIGRVSDLIHAGNDLLEIELESRKVLIPFVQAIVPEVQLEAGWIGITPPPGLLDL
mgnify:CR=1 FL=1